MCSRERAEAVSKKATGRGRVRHDESTIFTIWVMWVIGFSESKIGSVVGKSRKQISGIIARSPYSNRSALSMEERQKALEELVQMRFSSDGTPLDGGLLDRIPHKVIPLTLRQIKKGRTNDS